MNTGLYTLWLFGVAFSLAGVQFVYSSQFALGTPLFQLKFGLSPQTVNIILTTAGPISGFIVQPIIGAISDKFVNNYGRRRPFIVVGTVATVIGMIFIACSAIIGSSLGDKDSGKSPSDHVWAMTFAIFGLWMMNLFNNVTQGPARALVNDVTDEDKKQLANATTAGVMSFSAIAANLIGANFLNADNPYFIIFLLAAGFVFFSMIPTIICGKEVPYFRPSHEESQDILKVFKQIFSAFRNIKPAMAKVVLIYFLSWVSYTPLMVNQTILFANNVYPHREKNFGIFMGMYGAALFSTVAFNFSLISPKIIDTIGPKYTYIFTQVVATACYVVIWAQQPLMPWVALIFTSITAWNFTAFNSIPFALTSEIVGKEECGLYMGVLNSASVVAQTVAGLLIAPILSWKNDVAWGIGFGAIFSVFAIFAAFFIEGPPKDALLEDVESVDKQ